MKQTAVEWLSEQFDSIVELYPSQFERVNRALLQAKEMEKEQIEDAYETGFADAWDDARYDDEPKYATAEQYYNETFKSE